MEAPLTPKIVNILVLERNRVEMHTFSEHSQKGLFTLTFNLLGHMEEYINRFGSLDFLDDSSFENFNLTLNKSYRRTSLRHGKRTTETVRSIGRVMNQGASLQNLQEAPENIIFQIGLCF